MHWKSFFAPHILERGYDYYYENSVKNLKVTDDTIKADVIGSKDYEVEISLNNGEIKDMYCSCPYASDGRNCKHMAAVLLKWSKNDYDVNEDTKIENVPHNDFINPASEVNLDNKKMSKVEDLVSSAKENDVRSFLVSVLAENETLLLRFKNLVNKQMNEEDIRNYIKEIDKITHRYLGRNHFIDYYKAYEYISELKDFLSEDVQGMIDNRDYLSAFEVMNYMFVLIGNVAMDDSGGSIGILADDIYERWVNLLIKASTDEKRKMFNWFISHFDGSFVDYLEEYLEQIIIEEFNEKEYEQDKLNFIQNRIESAEQGASDWNKDYNVGKWAVRYLDMLKMTNAPEKKIEEVCKEHWANSSVRRYYIDMFMEKKEYDHVLNILDECMILDKQYAGLISKYSMMKKEIYLLQGNKDAYVKQLWQLVLKHEVGNLDVYKELKGQYTDELWLIEREKLFKKLPAHANIEKLYNEEKLYDRLLDYVLNYPGLNMLQEYENVLKDDYPEQILVKYQNEVNKMALYPSDRNYYAFMVLLLKRMQNINGGLKLVDQIVAEWKIKYKNRPAMMDELRKL